MERLPAKIEKLLGSVPFETDSIGMSGAGVRLYPDVVLKISRDDESARREADIMRWLRGKLPVPEILACERAEGRQYLLMTRLPGRMLCDKAVIGDAIDAARLLTRALEMVGSVDISGCPYRADLETELAIARRSLQHNTDGHHGHASPDLMPTCFSGILAFPPTGRS